MKKDICHDNLPELHEGDPVWVWLNAKGWNAAVVTKIGRYGAFQEGDNQHLHIEVKFDDPNVVSPLQATRDYHRGLVAVRKCDVTPYNEGYCGGHG